MSETIIEINGSDQTLFFCVLGFFEGFWGWISQKKRGKILYFIKSTMIWIIKRTKEHYEGRFTLTLHYITLR